MVKTPEGIVVWPSEVLDGRAKAVTQFGPALEPLLADLAKGMKDAEGIGIAAPQIGVALRVALVGRGDDTSFEIVNPEIVSSEGPVEMTEGCLSVPDERETVTRFRRVRVRYQDRLGEWHELDAQDELAHVLQHEIDHLDGIVYVKRLSPLRRRLIRERMAKLQKKLERGAKKAAPGAAR